VSIDASTKFLVEQVVEAYESDTAGLVNVAPCVEGLEELVEAAVEGISHQDELSTGASHVEEPPRAGGRVIVLECRGGSDKGEDGHRRDTLPICDALRSKGWAADAMFFNDASYDECKAAMTSCQGVVVRVNPVCPPPRPSPATESDVCVPLRCPLAEGDRPCCSLTCRERSSNSGSRAPV
jgi:hypothetical protein